MNPICIIKGRVPSFLIAGPANFSVRKKERQNAIREKNTQDWRRVQGLLEFEAPLRGSGESLPSFKQGLNLKSMLRSIDWR